MAPKRELVHGSESTSTTKYRMGSDGLPVAVTTTNTNLASGSSLGVEIDMTLKKAKLVLIVEGIPIEYKGESITLAEAEKLKREDPEYRHQLIKHNNNIGLLRNQEVLRMIMKLVVTPDTTLFVKPVASGSNIFYWHKDQINRNYQWMKAIPELEAPKLSRLCQGLYTCIDRGHLLYLYAQFNMPDGYVKEKITYLPAITPDRRKMIRHISCLWHINTRGSAIPMFTMLMSLPLLKTLELRLDVLSAYTFKCSNNDDLTKIGGFQKLALLLHVRQVELDLVVNDLRAGSRLDLARNDTLALREEILKALKTCTVKKCNVSEAAVQGGFDKLELKSELNVLGSERLGLPREKISIIMQFGFTGPPGADPLGRNQPAQKESTGQKVNQKRLTITKSRILQPGDYDYDHDHQGCNVKFDVHYAWNSRESAITLCSYENRIVIIQYYRENLGKGAQGIAQVIQLWQSGLENRYQYGEKDFPQAENLKEEIKQQNRRTYRENRDLLKSNIASLEEILELHESAVSQRSVRVQEGKHRRLTEEAD